MISRRKVLYIIIGIIVFAAMILMVRKKADTLKDSGPYKAALEYALKDEGIIKKSGGVRKVNDAFHLNQKGNKAYVKILLNGFKNDIKVDCYLKLVDHTWEVDSLSSTVL